MNRMLALKIAQNLSKRSSMFTNQRFLFKHNPLTSLSTRHNQTKPLIAVNLIHRYYHDDFHDTEEEPLYEYVFKEPPISIKNVLYPKSDDPLIEQLKTIGSLQEVFNFTQKYEMILECKHLAQAVLVMWDLQKMFYHVNVISNVAKVNNLMRDYIEQLLRRSEFAELLGLIGDRIDGFETEELSCVLLYLHKIGVPLKDEVMQKLIMEMKTRLEDAEGDFPLRAVARFIVSVFGSSATTAYFICQDIMPKIFDYIDQCNTAEELRLLTICLNYLNRIVKPDTLDKYKQKVVDLTNSGVINKNEYSTILKIILFLNFPHWRDGNVDLMADCMALFKDNIHLLNVYELIILSNIFYRTHQPATILNNIQRHACKFLYQLEEEMSPYLDIRLKLLTCIICFSSPSQRPHFEKIIRNYLNHKMSGENLMELYTVFHFMNNSNISLCKTYWDKVLEEMESDQTFRENHLLKIGYNYLTFMRSPNFRNLKFEKRMNQWLEGELEQGISNIIPSRFAMIGSFFIAYNRDVSLINHVAIKLDAIWEQLNINDCHHLSRSLKVGKSLINPALKPRYEKSLTDTLNKCFEKDSLKDLSTFELVLMLKTALYGQDDNPNLERLLEKLGDDTVMSSRIIKNLTFCLLSLNVLIPDVVDAMVDYVCEKDGDILAFNVENVAYLCFYLGYTPKNHLKFFEVLKDVLLRDQERLSGLSYIQSCISLCYFNTITDTFIKQIFNPSFLEKIDAELLSCYSKDIYPLRVRNRLMELNRSICIDYPESNVPWFHQKYVENINNRERLNMRAPITDNIQEYLVKMFDTIRIRRNVATHYGYQIDYVINFCQDVAEESKLALLVLGPKAFTKVNVQLRGYYQQKIRHLEMFGYRVAILKFTDWKDLVCGEDRISYLNSIVSQKLGDVQMCEINR